MSAPVTCVAMAVLATQSATVAPAATSLDCAYYAPDRGTPYQWFEGATGIRSFFSRDYRAAGSIYAYVQNEGNAPLTPTDFVLNGTPLAELREQRSVLWWRLLPSPLPAGAVGEVTVRLREALDAAARLEVRFDRADPLTITVQPDPAPLRIETVGFTESLDEVFVVTESLDQQPHQLSSVFLDGKDVTADCKLLDPTFFLGVAPVLLKLAEPLPYGSYHVIKVAGTEAEAAACCVRAYDGWVPLGSYGYSTYEEYARNGANDHNNFGVHSEADLDIQARLQMRGVMIIGDAEPAAYMRGHPGLFAYCLADEPDCADYGAEEWPPELRIGFHALEMERRAQTCRQADPHHLTFLTIDLTYKPANYYIYGQIADVTNVDCYPLSLGADATMVREVVETARRGAGPHPVTFTFQGVFEEPYDAEKRAAMRFPRPAFAEEERIMHYYAIGAGARGLYNYIHCTERAADYLSRGSQEFPDVWYEIGRTYRELQHVAPLLALAHPTALGTANRDGLWLRTLLCGDQALLIVCVNDNYEQLAKSFRCTALEDVRVGLPRLPWLQPEKVWRVTEDGFEPLGLSDSPDGAEVRLDRIEVAELLLVSSDERLARRLQARYRDREELVGAGLLGAAQYRLAQEAQQRRLVRKTAGEHENCAVYGTALNAYGIEEERFWNPAEEQYNGLEFGVNEAEEGPEMGVEWRLSVPPERDGLAYVVHVMHGAWGRPGIFTVRDAKGSTLVIRELSGGWPATLTTFELGPLAAGEYSATFMLPGRGPKGGRTARALYLVPQHWRVPGDLDAATPQRRGNS